MGRNSVQFIQWSDKLQQKCFNNNSYICNILLKFFYNKLFIYIQQDDIKRFKLGIYPTSLYLIPNNFGKNIFLSSSCLKTSCFVNKVKNWFFFYIQDINNEIIIQLNIIIDGKTELTKRLFIFLPMLTIFY